MTPNTIVKMISRLKRRLTELGSQEAEIARLILPPVAAKNSAEALEILERTRLVFPDMTVELAGLLRPSVVGFGPDIDPIFESGIPAVRIYKDRPFRPITDEGNELILALLRLTAAQVDIDNLARQHAVSRDQVKAVQHAADEIASSGAKLDALEALFLYLTIFFKPEAVIQILMMLVGILVPAVLDAHHEATREKRDAIHQSALLNVLEGIKQQHQSKVNYYATRNLNLRSGPGKEHSIIARVENGSLVELIELSGAWAKVIIQDDEGKRVGWVYKPFLNSVHR